VVIPSTATLIVASPDFFEMQSRSTRYRFDQLSHRTLTSSYATDSYCIHPWNCQENTVRAVYP
jgi:hypothetical protein